MKRQRMKYGKGTNKGTLKVRTKCVESTVAQYGTSMIAQSEL